MLFLLIFVSSISPSLGLLNLDDSTESLQAEARELIDAGRYPEAEQLLLAAVQVESGLVECHFLLGFVLAKQEKWLSSRKELELAVALNPRHGRAYTELAGVEFKLGNRNKAIDHLKRAEELDSDLEYVRTFLATLLYLEYRKTEALFYWNKVGAPRVDQISYITSDTVSPELLQKLFPLNEGEVFRREQVLDIWWKQGRFQLGSPFNWQITPRATDKYDLDVTLAPGSILSSLELLLLENAVRAPLYREVSIEYPMTLGSGKRIAGRFRWDEPRKRVQISTWLPFVSSSSDSLVLDFDLRDEEWKDSMSGTEFPFETRKLLAGYQYLFEGRKSLELYGGYENQRLLLFPEYSNLPGDPHFALLGTEWKQKIGLSASDDLQFQVTAGIDGFLGYGAGGSRSGRGHARLELGWLIEKRSRSEIRLALSGGHANSSVPLNHFFILGIGQDNPLPLRAHPTVDRGRKGNSPMGRQCLLANLEINRRVLNWRVLEIEGLLFGDAALVDGAPSGDLGRQWFQDVGFGFRLGALGQKRIELLFGFDLEESNFNLWVGIPVVRW